METRPTAVRGPSRWDDSTVARLSKLVVELEWAILAEALPGPEEIDPLSATTEEFKACRARHPRRGHPPPREPVSLIFRVLGGFGHSIRRT